MKKFIAPILVIIGFFALMYIVLASTDRTTVCGGHCQMMPQVVKDWDCM